MPHALTDLLVPHVSEPGRTALSAVPDLEPVLTEILASCRTSWPEVELGPEDFLPYLARRVPAEGDPRQGLLALNAADLYIACACARGHGAIEALERRYFGEVQIALGKLRYDTAAIEETKQLLRHELFVVEEGAAPGIGSYSGRGQLRRWLRVVATRIARKRVRRRDGEVLLEDQAMAELPDSHEDPELHHLKQRYREAFHAAFAEAMAALDERDRLLLRQHLLDGLNIDEIAALHGVHRATAARWLAAAREDIAARTRSALLQRTQAARGDLDSLMRLVRSQIDVSIRGYLRGPA